MVNLTLEVLAYAAAISSDLKIRRLQTLQCCGMRGNSIDYVGYNCYGRYVSPLPQIFCLSPM